jgi:hypothetical protein
MRFYYVLREDRMTAYALTAEELGKLDPKLARKTKMLERVLWQFGFPVKYLNQNYKMFTYWRDHGVDVGKEFDRLQLEEGKSVSNIIDDIVLLLKPIGLPQGRFSLGLRDYLRFILRDLGRLQGYSGLEAQASGGVRREIIRLQEASAKGGKPSEFCIAVAQLERSGTEFNFVSRL